MITVFFRICLIVSFNSCSENLLTYDLTLEGYVQREIFHLRKNGTGFLCQGGHCHDSDWKLVQLPAGTIQLDVFPDNSYEDFTIFCDQYMITEYASNTVIYQKK